MFWCLYMQTAQATCMLMDERTSEFPGMDAEPTQAQRGPGTHFYNIVSNKKKKIHLFLHFLTPVDCNTTLLLKYEKKQDTIDSYRSEFKIFVHIDSCEKTFI